MNVTDLKIFGWNEFFETNFESYGRNGYSCGRVTLEHKNFFRIYTEHGDLLAEISGKLRHDACEAKGLACRGRLGGDSFTARTWQGNH
jgi:ribosome biogenesis GTPase